MLQHLNTCLVDNVQFQRSTDFGHLLHLNVMNDVSNAILDNDNVRLMLDLLFVSGKDIYRLFQDCPRHNLATSGTCSLLPTITQS